MHDMMRRVALLEQAANPRTPVLVAWEPGADGCATADHQGARFLQAANESRGQFLDRVAATIPGHVVWVDQLDAKL